MAPVQRPCLRLPFHPLPFALLLLSLAPFTSATMGSSGLATQQECPDNCSGHGSCTQPVLRFSEEAPSAPGAPSKETPVFGPPRCECYSGFAGKSCSGLLQDLDKCPGRCGEGKGQCVEQKCQCFHPYSGPDCGINLCPNFCSKRGTCGAKGCECHEGWSGSSCSQRMCLEKDDCSGHGRCDNGECWCHSMYTGDDCSWASSCYNFCSGRGKCVNDNCLCDPLFTGVDCSEARCPRDCSQRGDCIDGVCLCEAGFDGVACETEILWPMRCSAQRMGLESSLSCKRGLAAMDVPPPTGTQMFKVQFDAASGTIAGARKMSAVNSDV